MKKVFLIAFLIMGIASITTAQNKQLEKAWAKQTKEKIKELKKEGWKINDPSKTIEVALLEHNDKVNSKGFRQYVGRATCTDDVSLCAEFATMDAGATYATYVSSFIKGNADRLNSKIGKVQTSTIISGFERLVQSEIKNVLQESYALVKQNGAEYQYQIAYIVNEDEAHKATMNALKNALDENKVSIEVANEISDFVNDGFKKESKESNETK